MDKNGIINDVKTWIDDFVTNPNPLLNDFPPCPYARKAMLEQKVDIRVHVEGSVSYAIADTLQTWDDSFDVIALIFDSKKHDGDTFNNIVMKANDTIDKSFVLLDDHPDNVETINGVHMNNGQYAIVFCQRTKKLQDAHDYLKNHTDYYDVWSQENLDDVVTWRKDRKRS